jgi:hypothetical protein
MNVNSIDILKAFFSNDNQLRKQAESYISDLAQNDPNASMDLHTQALELEETQVYYQ